VLVVDKNLVQSHRKGILYPFFFTEDEIDPIATGRLWDKSCKKRGSAAPPLDFLVDKIFPLLRKFIELGSAKPEEGEVPTEDLKLSYSIHHWKDYILISPDAAQVAPGNDKDGKNASLPPCPSATIDLTEPR